MKRGKTYKRDKREEERRVRVERVRSGRGVANANDGDGWNLDAQTEDCG